VEKSWPEVGVGFGRVKGLDDSGHWGGIIPIADRRKCNDLGIRKLVDLAGGGYGATPPGMGLRSARPGDKRVPGTSFGDSTRLPGRGSGPLKLVERGLSQASTTVDVSEKKAIRGSKKKRG